MKELKVKILTPEGALYEGTADLAGFPGSLGAFVVLPGHDAIISSLEKGDIRIGRENPSLFAIESGFVKVKDDEVIACVEV